MLPSVLRWEILLSKRQIFTAALVFFGLMVIPQIIALLFNTGGNPADNMAELCVLVFLVYFVLCGTTIFSSLKTRQQRIYNFMLPASNKEKFIARYLVLVVATPLAAFIGFLAGDLVQHILTMLFGKVPDIWGISEIFKSFNNFRFAGNAVLLYNGLGSTVSGPMTLLLGTIFQHACFLLLGSIFHKHPLVMSILTWMGLGILFLTASLAGAKLMADILSSGYTIILYDNWWIAISYIVSIAIIIFCFWFAYRRYTRLQVINNQWINK